MDVYDRRRARYHPLAPGTGDLSPLVRPPSPPRDQCLLGRDTPESPSGGSPLAMALSSLSNSLVSGLLQEDDVFDHFRNPNPSDGGLSCRSGTLDAPLYMALPVSHCRPMGTPPSLPFFPSFRGPPFPEVGFRATGHDDTFCSFGFSPPRIPHEKLASSPFAKKDSSKFDLRRNFCDRNVFVFHLPFEWKEQQLVDSFSHCGRIMSAKVVQRPDGTSKGYGFVCFEDHMAALRAVMDMNGHRVAGKRLKVSLKKTPEECVSHQIQKLMADSQSWTAKECTLFVFHLPSSWDHADLMKQFAPLGCVSARVAKKCNGTSRGFGFVTFASAASAALAIIHMNGALVENKRLKVQLKQPAMPPAPPGSTIFIFHIPPEWTDETLARHFTPFGRLTAATVQRDAVGQTRGFGFVGYELATHARQAVQCMHGFSVGHKRLKVTLKKSDYLKALSVELGD